MNICAGHISKVLFVTMESEVICNISCNGEQFKNVLFNRDEFNTIMRDDCLKGEIIPSIGRGFKMEKVNLFKIEKNEKYKL